MRAALALLALCLPAVLPAAALAETAADRFSPRRGFATDIWVEWQSTAEMVANPGFLDTYPDYPRHIPPEALARLHDHGFDTLRIAADPSPLLALAGTAREAGLLDNLRARVEEAQKAGLKVILDLHTFPHAGDVGDVDAILADPARFQAYLDMLSRVAARLSDLDPARTALEVMNEPTQDCEAIYAAPERSTWPDKLKRLHDAARAAAPDLPLVLSGACWGGSRGLAVLDPALIGDDNVLWSFHTYDPFTFSHQGADWTGNILMFIKGLPYPPKLVTRAIEKQVVAAARARAEASDDPLAAEATVWALRHMVRGYRHGPKNEISAAITEATDWADAHGIPRGRLFLGEFGALWYDQDGQQMDPASHLRFLTDKRKAAEAAGLGWAVWSFSGNFAITGAEARLMPEVCGALGLDKC